MPEPARPVEFSRYLGRWYEIGVTTAASSVAAGTYGMQPDGLIRVLNICRMGSAGGAPASPKVYRPGSENTKLKVRSSARFFGSCWESFIVARQRLCSIKPLSSTRKRAHMRRAMR
jgi:apolipoprotein D and lipocalin family protein